MIRAGVDAGKLGRTFAREREQAAAPVRRFVAMQISPFVEAFENAADIAGVESERRDQL